MSSKLSELFRNASPKIPLPGSLKKLQKFAKSSISDHIVNSSHSTSPEASFRIIDTVRRVDSIRMQMKNVCTVEAIAIHQFKPNICSQKQYVQSPSFLSFIIYHLAPFYFTIKHYLTI